MPRLPRITVVTPSLNQGAYLEQCIRSVISQGYPQLEYFIIDGGSTDESVSIIRKHAASIAFWVSERDEGQSDAINKGISRATGDLVAWLNADDYYLPGALKCVAEAYLANPDAPFYFGDGVRIDEVGNEIGRFCTTDRVVFDHEALLFGLNYILQPAAFISCKMLKRSGPLDTNLHYGMDSDLWMRLAGCGVPQPIQALLAATREYAATKTASGGFGRIEELRKISLRYSGAEITPGVLSYYLDTLFRYIRERDDIFPQSFSEDLVRFWRQTQKLLERYHAGPDGFPHGETSTSAPSRTLAASRPLKIGIDLRQIVLGASGGISQLVKGVLESAFTLDSQHEFLVFCTPFNRSLLDSGATNVRFFSLAVPTFLSEMDRIAREERLDVLIRSYPMEDALAFPLAKQVVLIPDNQHEIFPEFFSADALRTRRVAFERALGRAGAIGTISEFSKNALAAFPATRCRDFFLMPPALQRSHREAPAETLSRSERALIPSGDYFLFPANLWKHKNHLRVLRAFRQFVERSRREVTLVLTGHPDGWMELAGQFPGLPVRHLGFVRPELLRVLYERARALVFFSLYEGFGIPVLEAFDAGVPVICSNTTSLPEVAGDAALMCDPTDIEGMAGLMERILTEAELRSDLVRRGRARLSAYSWERSAHNLLQACIRVADLESQREPDRTVTARTENPAATAAPPPVVSIVTPSYNQGRFLQRTVDSVLSQSYPNIEYIVIDGGSKDESVEILRSYGDRLAWISEPDGGQAHAINKGMARMSGEILAYLNSDDVLLPGAIARVVKFFWENPDCDMVYGDADYINEDDLVTGIYRTAPYSFPRLMEDCMVCQPAAFWRRRIADKVGPFNERLDYAMDYDYWQRIDRAGGVIRYLPERLACSRRYPETKTLSARAAIHREIFRVCKANTGDVHQNFFNGYWHHLFHERDALWSRLLRLVPGLEWRIAWLHHKWYNRDNITLRDVVMFLYGWIKVRVVAAARFIGRPFRTLLRTSPSGSSVSGYKTDNWVEPVLYVPPRRRVPGHRLHVAGIAPLDSVATVWAGRTQIGTFPLTANQYQEITFPADAIDDKSITIRFSNYFVDGAKRRLSFLLQDTNIFAEHDTQG